MPILIHPVTRPELPAFPMSDRFRHEITYFMTCPGDHGVPPLPTGEYWIRLCDARACLEAGVVSIVSPLDSDSRAELELTEEQEAWLDWMVAQQVEHVRIEKVLK